MVRRQIELDEDSDRILSGLADDYQGDLGKALADLLHTHRSMEEFVAACEEAERDSLLTQKKRAERGFAEGRFTPWKQVKIDNDL
jgi:thymidine kinase